MITLGEFAKSIGYDPNALARFAAALRPDLLEGTDWRGAWYMHLTDAKMFAVYHCHNLTERTEPEIAARAVLAAFGVSAFASPHSKEIKRPSQTLNRYIERLTTLRRRRGPEECGKELGIISERFPSYAYESWLPALKSVRPDIHAKIKGDSASRHRPITVEEELRIAETMRRLDRRKAGRRPRAASDDILAHLRRDYIWLTGDKKGFAAFLKRAFEGLPVSAEDVLRSAH
jgi:hypothetical protein